jgi:hypothetical protein
LVMTVFLAAAPISASAQCGGGQMDHSMMMGSDHMGSSGQMGYGHMDGSGQMSPGHAGHYGYADPNATASGQPAGTWVPAPSGQATGNPGPYGHDHNH